MPSPIVIRGWRAAALLLGLLVYTGVTEYTSPPLPLLFVGVVFVCMLLDLYEVIGPTPGKPNSPAPRDSTSHGNVKSIDKSRMN